MRLGLAPDVPVSKGDWLGLACTNTVEPNVRLRSAQVSPNRPGAGKRRSLRADAVWSVFEALMCCCVIGYPLHSKSMARRVSAPPATIFQNRASVGRWRQLVRRWTSREK